MCYVCVIQKVTQSFQKSLPLRSKISRKFEKYLRGGRMTRTKHFSDYCLTNNNNKRVAYFARCLVKELFVNFAKHFCGVLVLKSSLNEWCNKKARLLSYALLYCIVIMDTDKKTFRYSEINTLYIKNTNVMAVSPFFMKSRISKDVGINL